MLLAAASNSGTTITPFIAGGFAILVAVVTFGTTLVIERYRRRATDRRWLLDRRHEAYIEFLEQANECIRLVNASTQAKTEVSRTAAKDAERILSTAWYSVLLVGTDQAQWLSGQAWRAAQEAVTHLFDFKHPMPAVVAYRRAETALVTYLRAELQPRRRIRFRRRTAAALAGAASTPLDQPRPKR